MSTIKYLLRAFSLQLSIITLLSFSQSVFADDVARTRTPKEILNEEISHHRNPQRLLKALQEIFNESDPTQQIKLISPWLKPNSQDAMSKEKYPYIWASLHMVVGDAFQHVRNLHRADNLEQAITHYEQALQTHAAFSQDWAATQNSLAIAYSQRIYGERADNLERAIEHFQNALQIYNRENFLAEWSIIQNNLLLAYRDRIRGKRADNLERSIDHARQLLQVRTNKAFPTDWATTQNNLALVYIDRIYGEQAYNLEQAISHAYKALQVYTPLM